VLVTENITIVRSELLTFMAGSLANRQLVEEAKRGPPAFACVMNRGPDKIGCVLMHCCIREFVVVPELQAG
jgi:hypothetical protein